MSWKTIETSREIRQWVKILVPCAIGAAYLIIEHPDIFEKFKFKKKDGENGQKLHVV